MPKNSMNHLRAWYALLASITLLFVATALARDQQFVWGEVGLLHAVYQLPENNAALWLIITTLGSLWMVIWLSVIVMMLGKKWLAIRIVLAGALSAVIVSIAKYIVGRPRPGNLLEDIIPRSYDGLGFGFPSGHTAIATALGILIWPLLPATLKWLVPLWIGLVAISRLYLGVHAPLDIVGGFSIGCLVAVSLIIVIRPPIKTKRKLLAKRPRRA